MRKDQERLDKLRARQDQLVSHVAVRRADEKKARCMAIAIALEPWLEAKTEAERARVFVDLEAASKGRDRKRISTHPLRPASPPRTPSVVSGLRQT